MQKDSEIAEIVDHLFPSQETFLKKLVSTPSANAAPVVDMDPDKPIELEVAKKIKAELKASKIKSEELAVSKERPNIIATLGPKRARKHLVLHAHMDTPVASNQYRSDPYQPFVRGNKLYGLGTMQMKAPITAFVYAAKVLQEMKVTLGGKLTLQFAVDEVPGGESGLGIGALMNRGFRAKAAILGYAGDVIGIGHRGGYRFKLTTMGEAVATSAESWQKKERGKNAVVGMAKAITKLQDWELPFKPARAFPGKKPVFTFPTVIRGGDAYDKVPDKCFAIGDMRLMPGNSDRQVRLRLEEMLDKIEGLDYRLDDLVFVPAVEIDPKEEIVMAFQNQIEAAYGREVGIEGIGSWNTGWMFIQRDIPAIIQIPLKGGAYRGNIEWVSLPSLKKLTGALVKTVLEYLGTK